MPGDYSTSNHLLKLTGDFEIQDGEFIFDDNLTRIIEIADSADWQFPGAFTIELFGVKFANATNRHGLISQYDFSTNDRSWMFEYRANESPKILIASFSTDGTSGNETVVSDEFNATADTAYDLCVERDGSDNVRIYADGTMIAKGTASGALHNSGQACKIGKGASNTSGNNNHIKGSIKGVRITKGTARYADDGGYTVPDLPLPTS